MALQLGALLAEVPELQMVLPAAPASAAASVQWVAVARRECSQLARQRQRVLDELRGSSASRLPLAEQLRMLEQQAALGAARQQAATLATAAQCLQEGIDSSNPQVCPGCGVVIPGLLSVGVCRARGRAARQQ